MFGAYDTVACASWERLWCHLKPHTHVTAGKQKPREKGTNEITKWAMIFLS
jgi:hypothetical protein